MKGKSLEAHELPNGKHCKGSKWTGGEKDLSLDAGKCIVNDANDPNVKKKQ